MIISPEPIELEIDGVKFKIKPLTGLQSMRLLSGGGLEKIQKMDAEQVEKVLRTTVIGATFDGKEYGPEIIEIIDLPTLVTLTNAVIDYSTFQRGRQSQAQ